MSGMICAMAGAVKSKAESTNGLIGPIFIHVPFID
jgi:hypothetical protein